MDAQIVIIAVYACLIVMILVMALIQMCVAAARVPKIDENLRAQQYKLTIQQPYSNNYPGATGTTSTPQYSFMAGQQPPVHGGPQAYAAGLAPGVYDPQNNSHDPRSWPQNNSQHQQANTGGMPTGGTLSPTQQGQANIFRPAFQPALGPDGRPPPPQMNYGTEFTDFFFCSLDLAQMRHWVAFLSYAYHFSQTHFTRYGTATATGAHICDVLKSISIASISLCRLRTSGHIILHALVLFFSRNAVIQV
ncbi:unnamed protein product [Amoebophrya sp. A25]|nr:unnamed protein product [Amoebophrya sp. A25]|eukprot:GSA25T00005604001.1